MDLPIHTLPLQDEQSAASRVFNIPELLETILLNLSIKDLLLSQRTSRSFRYTVAGSIRLRRKLFFEPDWNLEGRLFDAYASHNRPGRKPENNRLLLRAFPGCYPTITLVIVSDGASSEGGLTQSTLSGGIARHGSEQWSWDVCISFPADKKPNCSPAVDYPEASWRKMFLSQPPCQSLYLVRRWQRSKKPAMVREAGITMGDFFTEATQEQPSYDDWKWHQSYISSDADWHFEGNIKCSSVEESSASGSAGSADAQLLNEYSYSKTLLNGRVRALSDEWDPGHAVEFGAAARART
ncbi:hypothetical protein M409DRAFT_68520 [Zasmidium cellare ATCC 36951]|uniref:F-box domain-containing protein n=1 Tax=Zasmidium cellare ATCC 36951 TaxID=1080233 RepID=A0A6A6CC00_ZASCE|nr:uncharacterized protein M409DRAFT_68520 [Zasmidium cellare ATCC 36951]KAF2163199.1 hypothetical protein M409DRAFT_68520 [Zasmidium cellare ATCC 36951]